MSAELFGTAGTVETFIRIGGKAFGNELIGYLPAKQECYGKYQKNTCKPMSYYKNKGSKHHSKIPIVYTAVGATAVSEKYRMKGTVKENTDHIANAEHKTYYKQYTRIYYTEIIQQTKDTVKCQPRRRNYKGTPPCNV